MKEIIFALIGSIGVLIIIYVGNRLLKSPRGTAKSFARFMASAYAILVASLALIAHGLDAGWILLVLILSAITYIVAYPLAFYFHQRKHDRPQDPR